MRSRAEKHRYQTRWWAIAAVVILLLVAGSVWLVDAQKGLRQSRVQAWNEAAQASADAYLAAVSGLATANMLDSHLHGVLEGEDLEVPLGLGGTLTEAIMEADLLTEGFVESNPNFTFTGYPAPMPLTEAVQV